MFSTILPHFSFSIICFDLDETILNHSEHQQKKSIQPFINILNEYKKKGTKIIYATARNFKDTTAVIKKVGLIEPDYLITNLGMDVYEEEVRKDEISIGNSVFGWNEKIINKYLNNRNDLISRKPERSSKYKKAFYIKNPEPRFISSIRRELKKLGQLVDVVESGKESIYVIPQSWSKGRTLKILSDTLNVSKTDIVVAGDSPGDYSMFAKFKNSILVGNADESVVMYVRKKYPHVFISRYSYAEGAKEGLLYFDELHNGPLREFISKFNFESPNFTSLPKTLKGKIITHLLQGHILERQGSFLKAKIEYQKGLQKSMKIIDQHLKYLFEILITKMDISLGRLKIGIPTLESLVNKTSSIYLKNYFLNSLAYAYRIQGKNDDAICILNSLIQSGQSEVVLSALHNLAGVKRDLGKYKESLKLYERVRTLAQGLKKDDFFMSRVYNNIGFIYRRMGEYVLAERYYLKSYILEKKVDSLYLQGRTLNNLGGVNRMKGKFEKALSFFEESIEIRKSIKDRSGLSSSFLNKGIVLAELGRKKEAKQFLKMSYTIRKNMGSQHLINEVLTEIKKIS